MSELRPVSIVISIVSYHSPLTELSALLTSLNAAITTLEEAGRIVGGRVVLVDNGETPLKTETLQSLSRLMDGHNMPLQYLQGHGNIGYGGGHNLVIQSAGEDIHLLLNPDVVLQADSVLKGIDFLDSNADVAVVSPCVTDAAGVKQFLCKRYPTVGILLLRGFFPPTVSGLFRRSLADYEMQDLAETEPTHDVPLVSGCCMLCRGKLLRQVSGFDERYFLYFEDFDLSMRIREFGKLAYVPAMKIVHHGGNTAAKGWHHIRLFVSSGRRFFNTWGWRFF